MIRYHAHSTPEEDFYTLLQGLDVRQQRSLLIHPSWDARCACRMFGRPYGASVAIIDFDTVHGTAVCQPRREWLPGSPS